MRKFDLELGVGLFMIAGILALGYLSVRLAKMEVIGQKGYDLEAVFSNSGGLKTGASVVIAGVDVGRVKSIRLEDYQALISIHLPSKIKLQDDAIATIKTKGLIGEKYVEITPGGSEDILKPGQKIRDTQPPVDLEQLISSYVFGKL
ncbi:MAG: outer membrane lipid asymmetry maintenance protein MlaD [Deltaproteobacteria bacterium]|nr:MAG: outer membrane lipid asymmetry maintenance protein MlaD [Desulfobacteraceae bacterium 4484_190.3]RLB18914.1 MAG: outer membrane lipid asymmetry maintenance protein MlaD [Deltaproteobacteria bacterium]